MSAKSDSKLDFTKGRCLVAVRLWAPYKPEPGVKMKIIFLLAFMFMVASASHEAYCPKRYTFVCVRSINECCSDDDCDRGQFCCQENCGNTCQFTTSFPTDGRKVVFDKRCRIEI
ncbi:u15-lycotoxin-Ls1a [Trichonephila clavipes]|nr:u15-lycotoxin-Ls1a [Trichonephila clavipes]